MAKNAKPTLRKPVLSAEAVLGFAEGRTARKLGEAAQRRGSAQSAVKPSKAVLVSDNSRFPPAGDVRLTVNVREDLHLRLKIEAAKRRSTVGQILEELVEANLAK